jgi:hypothetical protein
MLLKKLFLFAILLLLAEQLLFHTLIKKKLPAFWGNEELSTKMNYVNTHPAINTVFIGSSKIKTQVLPAVFDSVTQNKTRSFNLGCNGLFIPESFNIIDKLLDGSQIKTILFEMRPVYHIYTQNLHISRSTYYHTMSSYWSVVKNIHHSTLPVNRKLSAFVSFSISMAENALNFNITDGIIGFKNFNTEKLNREYEVTAGCVPRGRGQTEALKKAAAELDAFAALSAKYMNGFANNTMDNAPYNKAYLEQIQQVIQKANSKQVKIILVFPSALREFEYIEILPLLKKLQQLPQFVLADVAIYPELYKMQHNYETDHLNLEGSVLFSTYLGRAYNNLKGQ